MWIDTLQFLIRTLSELFVLVLLMRFYLQVVHAPFQHPLCQFVVACTNFIVRPARKVIPSIRSYDTATMVLACVISMLAIALLLLLSPLPYSFSAPQNWLGIFLLGILAVFKQSIYLLMGAVLVQAIMSWVNPYNAMRPILEALTQPFLRPFRRFTIANVDLSSLIVLILAQVILMWPVAELQIRFLSHLKFAL